MRLLLITIFLLTSTTWLPAQWTTVYNHSDQENRIFAVNADTIFTVTQQTRIFRSYDGGDTWSHFQVPFQYTWLVDIDFPTSRVGYACGGTAFGNYANVIVKTTDYGQTWDSLTANAYFGMTFTNIEFVTEDIGFVTEETGRLLKTTDGGLTFNPVTIDTTAPVFIPTALTFPTDSVGYCATYRHGGSAGADIYQVFKTVDQGDSWSSVYRDSVYIPTQQTRRAIWAMDFLDANTGFTVGSNGLFMKTTDGGANWNRTSIYPYSSDLTTVDFTSPLVGYTNNAGNLYKTVDGGTTWSVQTVSPAAIVSNIDFANDSTGFMLGSSLVFGGISIYRTTNAGGLIAIEDALDESHRLEVFPSPATGQVNIQYESGLRLQSLQLINTSGQIVRELNPTQLSMDVTNLPAGMYWLQFQSESGKGRKALQVVH